MKTMILSTLMILSAFAATAEAARKVEKETIVCQGREENEGQTLTLVAKSNSNIEDKAIAYWATWENGKGQAWSGLIFGYKSDVQLFLKPKKHGNVQVSGTIFMDDEEQNLDIDMPGVKGDLKLTCDASR